jgi:uncharacterized membrane protein
MPALSVFTTARWRTAALIASLLLNAFLIGAVATDSFRTHHRPGSDSSRAVGFQVRQFAGNLPKEGLDRIRAQLDANAPEVAEQLAELRRIRAEINTLAAQPQPDRAAIDARLTALRASLADIQAEVQKSTFDALLALPPDMRAHLVDPQGKD